jgi:hypothetical protein
VNEPVKEVSARISARRRLIRGAFAAPAALTLCSGSAFAAASSDLRSIARQVNDPRYPKVEANPTDTWVRVPVYSYDKTLVVSGADVAYFQGSANNRFITPNQWATVANPHSLVEPKSPPDATHQYAALRVDVDGTILGISTGSETFGSAVTMSSWTSFTGINFYA